MKRLRWILLSTTVVTCLGIGGCIEDILFVVAPLLT